MRKYVPEFLLVLFSIILIIGILFYINPFLNLSRTEEVVPQPEIKTAWGFTVDSVKIDTLRVKPNQCLSDMLTGKGISLSVVDQLAKNADTIFDVRKIKTGNPYYFISSLSSPQPECMVYEESAVNYYLFSLTDSLLVTKGVKDVDTIRSTMSGVIESSLWNSYIDQGANPVLAVTLSEIFAWTVDFFGIQKGDRYKVLYDQYVVDGNPAGLGRVDAALFISGRDTVTAFYFAGNGQEGYFDASGNSLRKAFLKAPLSYSRISSRFSSNRYHPVLKIRRPHYGVDYAAPIGTPVHSIGDGVVVKKAYQKGGGGNYLVIKHNSVYTSEYMHLSRYANGIATGVRVKQGQLIAFVGMTGLASGPHLDFRMFLNGTPVDPLKVKTPPVEPISEVNRALFNTVRDSLMIKIDSIPYPNSTDLVRE